MSSPIYKLRDTSTIQAKPTGQLLKGWLPGTIVNYVYDKENKYLAIDKASACMTKNPDLIGVGGFLPNGSYELKSNFDFRYPNNNEKTGYWTPDEVVNLAKSEENKTLIFDNQHLLDKSGKGLTTVIFESGCFKLYVYEKYDNDYLNSNGQQGNQIDWKSQIGQLFGCSPRSLFTSLDNNVCKSAMQYRLGGVFKDELGEYLYMIRK